MSKILFSAYFFLLVIFFKTTTAGAQTINAKELAHKYAIKCDKPAVDFFEGALLGNGGMGVVVNTRPDAIEFHFGHNNVWDIRVAERNKDKISNFQKVFDRLNPFPQIIKKFLTILHLENIWS